MEFLVLENEDSWDEIKEKLTEEYIEAKLEFARMELKDDYDKYRLASELLDVIQISIKALDGLTDEGLDLQQAFSVHNEKLKSRGWQIKYNFKLIKEENNDR